MKKIVILVLGLLVSGTPLYAQDQPDPAKEAPPQAAPLSPSGSPLHSENKDDFDYIKAEIARLLIENKRLESEYEALKQQSDELKARAHVKEREVEKAALADEEWQANRSHEKELNALKAVYGGVEQLRNEIMVKKSRTSFLSAQLVDLEVKQRPWKLRHSDLDYLKRELELDIQLLRYEHDAREQQRQEEINRLQDAIQKNLMEEREMLGLIGEIEEGILYDPQNLISLFEENQSLELQVMDLAHETEFQERENEILDKKRLLGSHSKNDVIDQKLDQKEHLRKEVEMLKQQVDKLHVSLDRSLQEKTRREEVLKNFVFLQQENDRLRNQVEAIHSKLNASDR